MNNTKNEFTPELRFPEFREAGKWSEIRLRDCLLQNPDYGINAPAVPFSEKLPTYLRITDISEDGRFISKSKVSVGQNVTENNYLNDGDIVLTRTGASVGKSYKYQNEDGRLVFAGFLIRVSPDKLKLSPDFLSQFLFTNQYWKWVNFVSARSGQPGINGTEFSSMPLTIPPTIKEQQKIASCLSSLDELISTHTQKLETLKEHKKALMQNLFPQEGEMVPKIRFSEFRNDGVWVEKTIDDIKYKLIDYVANGSFQALRENLNVRDVEDYAYYIRLTDLRAGLGHASQKYVDKSTYSFLNKSSLSGGELLMANIGANVGEVWQMPVVTKPATLAPNMILIKFGQHIDSQFIYSYLTSDIGKMKIASVISGSGHPKISKGDLKQVKISLPPKSGEQKKIAKCLSSIDAITSSQEKAIEHLKLYKRGLIQRLFPNVNRQ